MIKLRKWGNVCVEVMEYVECESYIGRVGDGSHFRADSKDQVYVEIYMVSDEIDIGKHDSLARHMAEFTLDVTARSSYGATSSLLYV